MAFPDLADEATQHLETGSGEPAGADTHPEPEVETREAAPAPESQGQVQTPAQTAQAIADLSKFKEVNINGQKMTIEDLQKSIMRQADYTKKTAELARQRQEAEKYSKNVWADLEQVKQNPQLAAEFMRIYPKQYHQALRFVMQQQTNAQQPQQQPQVDPLAIEERFSRYDQFINQTMNEKVEAERQALDKTLETIETSLTKKYPKADAITAYTLAEQRRAQIEQETGQKLSPRDINEQFMEPFFKASHESRLKEFNQWQKEMAKTARSVNKQASDVGRGGGTPGAAPAKTKLKDVADQILAGGQF